MMTGACFIFSILEQGNRAKRLGFLFSIVDNTAYGFCHNT
jgi:hypothetical protein